MNKPNILLITTDTQRCDTLKCMGNSQAVSPHADRLAGEGVLFTQAHTASPVCMPARCSLLTGYHTPVHGCIENGINRRTDVPVFTDFLRDRGYRNFMVGKTHFGPIPESFHVVKGDKAAHRAYLQKLGLEPDDNHPTRTPEEHFYDSWLTTLMTDEIETHLNEREGEPFFGFLSFNAPHAPITPPGKWADTYQYEQVPAPHFLADEHKNLPMHQRRLLGLLGEPDNSPEGIFTTEREAVGNSLDNSDPEKRAEYIRLYYGYAAYCDSLLGRVMDFLDKKGLRENTLVIFTSDHGQQYFTHGFNDKHNWYDESWRVPLIMSMPGTLPAGETRDFAGWTDLTATILAAAGSDHSWVQGYDLFTPLSQGADSPRRVATGTLYKSFAVATMKWKFEYYIEEGEGRLFNRIEDPLEEKDLYNDRTHEKIRNTFLHAALTWRSDMGDTKRLGDNSHGGGPVAKRLTPYTKSWTGRDLEERLAERLESIDA
jgi:arylsulfatase A-like enzyme